VAYLLMPSIKVTGIEDPLVSKAPVVEFWDYAWSQSRKFPGKQAASTALAINSVHGRD
jgi:CDP-diacylglycerol pyrophosphatase